MYPQGAARVFRAFEQATRKDGTGLSTFRACRRDRLRAIFGTRPWITGASWARGWSLARHSGTADRYRHFAQRASSRHQSVPRKPRWRCRVVRLGRTAAEETIMATTSRTLLLAALSLLAACVLPASDQTAAPPGAIDADIAAARSAGPHASSVLTWPADGGFSVTPAPPDGPYPTFASPDTN
jgi:hypothetical protein